MQKKCGTRIKQVMHLASYKLNSVFRNNFVYQVFVERLICLRC